LANKALKWVVQARGEKEQHVFETRTFNIGMLKWIVCRGGMLSIFYLITKRVHIILSAAFYCTGVCVCQEREMRAVITIWTKRVNWSPIPRSAPQKLTTHSHAL
jgi:hypothetical protein